MSPRPTDPAANLARSLSGCIDRLVEADELIVLSGSNEAVVRELMKVVAAEYGSPGLTPADLLALQNLATDALFGPVPFDQDMETRVGRTRGEMQAILDKLPRE